MKNDSKNEFSENGKLLALFAKENEKKFSYIKKNFRSSFDCDAEGIFMSPGRSEIIGNHTDHQHGCCIVCAVNAAMYAAVASRNDNIVEIVSEGFVRLKADISSFEVVASEKGTSQALVRGIAAGLSVMGYKTGGFNAFITSDIKPGSGLSSSAAYEMLIACIFNSLYNANKISVVRLAQTAQKAENEYFGKPCGLEDMLACGSGGLTYMDFHNAEVPALTPINTDFAEYGYSLVVTDTHSSHEGLTDEYASIRSEMEQVASFYDKPSLAYVNKEDFFADIKELRQKCSDRAVLRAVHFFNENERVKSARDALEREDFAEFLRLVNESGESSFMYLQNVYSCSDGDRKLALALCISKEFLEGKGACRVHGGGFGGTVAAIVPIASVKGYISLMDGVFGEGSASELEVSGFGSVRIQ